MNKLKISVEKPIVSVSSIRHGAANARNATMLKDHLAIKKKATDKGAIYVEENYLDSIYLLNCTQLYGKATRFDFFKDLKKLQDKSKLVASLIKLLEFDQENPTCTYLLEDIRSKSNQFKMKLK